MYKSKIRQIDMQASSSSMNSGGFFSLHDCLGHGLSFTRGLNFYVKYLEKPFS